MPPRETTTSSANSETTSTRVMVAAPIRNRAWILPEYLSALKQLEVPEGVEVGYFFLVNDSTDESLDILLSTVIGNIDDPLWPGAEFAVWDTGAEDDDRKNRREKGIYTHLQRLRDRIRQYAVDQGYDYLLSVDSDVIVQPGTLSALLAHRVDFVAAMLSNVPDGSFHAVNAAQVILGGDVPWSDPVSIGVQAPQGDGLVEVGMTGACFLASRQALENGSYLWEAPYGSNYEKAIAALPGEDMVFAMSLKATGIRQYLDESHRVFHCYTEERLPELVGARRYRARAVKVLTDRAWLKTFPNEVTPPYGGYAASSR